MPLLGIFLGLVFAYSLAAQRLERTVLTTEYLGSSMFIAAFVAGMAVQMPFPQAGRHSIELAAEWGQLLNLSVFFLFGTLSVAAWAHWTWPMVVYALSSLTVFVEVFRLVGKPLPIETTKCEGVLPLLRWLRLRQRQRLDACEI
jgi:hypothetical protein